MVKYIVAATFAVALVFGVGPVRAQTTCTQFGNISTCTGPGGASVTCTRIGNTTVCN